MSIRPTQPSTGTLASPVAENRLAAVLAAGHKAKDKFRTGKCYTVSSPNVVTAFYYVKEGGMVKSSSYELDERQCTDPNKMLVSKAETDRVFDSIRESANDTARMKMKENPFYYLRMNIDDDPNSGFIALLKCDKYKKKAEVEKYLFDDGTSGESAWSTAMQRLQTFLTEKYNDNYGPEFILSETA